MVRVKIEPQPIEKKNNDPYELVMLVGEQLRSFKPCCIVLEMSVLPQTNNAALLLAEQLVAE